MSSSAPPEGLIIEEDLIIETERLYLRRWRSADLAPFAAINACARVNEFLPGPLGEAQSNQQAQRIMDHFERHGFGFYALALKKDGSFIGFTGLNVSSFEAPFMPATEIGWRISANHWGKGYATEAAQAVISYARDELRLADLVSFTVPANQASRRVMEKIGMIRDEAGDFDHPLLPPGDPLRRHVLYRIDLSKTELT